jgi:hypothetical protein
MPVNSVAIFCTYHVLLVQVKLSVSKEISSDRAMKFSSLFEKRLERKGLQVKSWHVLMEMSFWYILVGTSGDNKMVAGEPLTSVPREILSPN